MALYRKRPVIVEAVQWFKMGDHPAVNRIRPWGRYGRFNKSGSISHNVDVAPGDYIVTSECGNLYVISKEAFEVLYEKVPIVIGEEGK